MIAAAPAHPTLPPVKEAVLPVAAMAAPMSNPLVEIRINPKMGSTTRVMIISTACTTSVKHTAVNPPIIVYRTTINAASGMPMDVSRPKVTSSTLPAPRNCAET